MIMSGPQGEGGWGGSDPPMPKIIALGGPLTPLAIEEPLLLSKQFCCYSPQPTWMTCLKTNVFGLAIIILAQTPSVLTMPITTYGKCKVTTAQLDIFMMQSEPFLGFQ